MPSNDKKNRIFYWERLISMTTCVMILAAVALQKNGTLFGTPADELINHKVEQQETPISDTLQVLTDGTLVVSTMPLASSVNGYSGPTPLSIKVKNGIIENIESEKNSETPDFYSSACEKIFPQYIGKSVDDALASQVDVMSGATYSSVAIIENMTRGLAYVQPHVSEQTTEISETPSAAPLSPGKIVASIIVILMGLLLPNWLRSKGYRLLQLLLNIIVLGFWCSAFVSYSLVVNFLANGINFSTALITLILLAVIMLTSLLGRTRHYCFWLCPLGSAQEFIYRISPFKRKIGDKTQRILTYARWVLWAVLMLLMWTGVWFEWMDYELFAIFLFQKIGWVVAVLAGIFGVLSIFVSRPYCRFVCPTGCMLQVIANKKLDTQM